MKTAVLLSGGVDSSVALFEVLKRKQDVTAYYLKIWLEDELSYLGQCPWEEDLSYAREVCEMAGVPLKVISLQMEYFEKVVTYALEELKQGRTPSPDIFCNLYIKFGVFFHSLDSTYEKVASGHYGIIEDREDYSVLKRSPDPVKDQTYFLSYMTQDQIRRAWFPIGGMYKEEVRALADELGLPNRQRKDSQGICFLGKFKYNDFVQHYLGEKRGEIINRKTGAVEGAHKGFWFHTIGQRTGLGLGNGPWYVSGKDPEKNIVYVTHQQDLKEFRYTAYTVSGCSWIYKPPVDGRSEVKLRHGPKLTGASITWIGQDRIRVDLDEGDSGIAPGQFTVFYDGDVCLGAGKIEGLISQL
jgi:tRNA-specific 2-thiouridylase